MSGANAAAGRIRATARPGIGTSAENLPPPSIDLIVIDMHRDVSLHGFLLTRDEWNSLDEESRIMLLTAVAKRPAPPARHARGTGPHEVDDYYESYEVIYRRD